MSFTSQLDWRFATKAFDPNKKVLPEDLATIMTAIQKTPSSFGIQPYHIIHVTNPDTRLHMRKASWDQPQVTDASDILLFCTKTNVSERIDEYVTVATGGDATAAEAMKKYQDMMHGALDGRSADDIQSWASRQTYIALGFGLAACAALQIDSCPMEGFDAEKVHQILELPDELVPLAYLTIGYRATEPERPKVRFPKEDLFSEK